MSNSNNYFYYDYVDCVEEEDFENELTEKFSKVWKTAAQFDDMDSTNKLKKLLEDDELYTSKYINRKNFNGEPLTFAFFYQSFSCDPLKTTAKERAGEMLRLLVKNGLNIDAVNNLGETCLNTKRLRGYVYFPVQEAIRLGANVNAANKKGETPLHQIVWNRDCDSEWDERYDDRHYYNARETQLEDQELIDNITSLCKAGADINARNNRDETPLANLCRRYNTQLYYRPLFYALADLGADLYAPALRGKKKFSAIELLPKKLQKELLARIEYKHTQEESMISDLDFFVR